MSRQSIVDALAARLGTTDSEIYWRDVVGGNPPYPPNHCGAACLWALHQAGYAMGIRWVIGRGFLADHARVRAPHEAPLPGDVAYRQRNQHHALVERVEGGDIWTIDANSDGGAVVRHRAPLSTWDAVYDVSPMLGSDGTSNGRKTILPPPAPPVVRGLDVSSYQSPAALDYGKAWELGFSFIYVRGVRAGKEIDPSAIEHVKRARAAGLQVGLYAFFSPALPVSSQVALMREAHRACGAGAGDLAPAVDIESFGSGSNECRASKSWVAPATDLIAALAAEFGTAVRYHNIVDWLAMGSPAWTKYPLWLASYCSTPSDACGPWAIWQQRSARVPELGLILDQNQARELPVISGGRVDSPPIVPFGETLRSAIDGAVRIATASSRSAI